MTQEITHDKKYQQFSIATGSDEEAELAYAQPSDDLIDFTHTYVPESARGTGLAFKLIEHGISYARENKLKVRATCTVVQSYFKRYPENNDLLH